ncbi:MAG: N-6 DNA methylase [Pseudomonadota bacterium]
MSQHTEWLSMIEVSGPFLAISVLEKVFPQGLEVLETHLKKRLRSAYEEWCDVVEDDDPQLPELHRAWNELVLKELLEFEDSVLQPVNGSEGFTYIPPDGGGQFTPDYVLSSGAEEKPMLLVSIFSEGTDLEKVKVGDGWPVPIYERMTLLCRSKGIRLGIITNGERWMLVNAPVGNTSSHVSWYARLWFQEPVTLRAFQSLIGVRRWFGPEEESLPAMLEESLQHHEEVTDTLGEQVKRAVEVLVQCLDKADLDRNRELLHDVPPAELYEAGLTVMMRLVFVLCAEERGLLLLGDSVYDQYYAIATLRGQLTEEADQHGHEVLERRHDAWARILAVFRAVFGGVEHETLRMPALGGSLFDPDRFPFLEGRAKGTHWLDTTAQPLPIDNRTVLLLLEALQVLTQRGGALLLSYKALDVEQIGHVYEGLLEHTVRRLPKDTLGLVGLKKAKNPNLTLAEIELARLDGDEVLISIIESTTQRSKSAIEKALVKEVDDNTFGKVVAVCGGDLELAKRIRPFTHLLRTDAWGDVIVYRAQSFAVTLGADRRETGTHYTPKSLTESIVETTLEPVAYAGLAEGRSRDDWQLKSSAELLELKICDPAMGSGAFLVQVCRWLSEHIVEAWGKEAAQGKFITVDGLTLDAAGSADPMPDSLDERLLIARRLVAEKCLYGVDLNPLAVELAKLSIWLITLAKGRPFGFLDHNLRSGDSLLGLHKLEQLTRFSLHPEKKQTISIFASSINAAIKDALTLRKKLRETPIRDIRDVQYMKRLDQQARQKLERIEHIADAMIGEALTSGRNERALDTAMDNLSILAAAYIEGAKETGRNIIAEARKSLSIDLPAGKPPRKPFHWALEFPEVFERGGFDGIVGNPPYLGGRKIRSILGEHYLSALISVFFEKSSANADLCAFFIRRTSLLLKKYCSQGFIATSSLSEGDTRETGLEYLLNIGFSIYKALSKKIWPGTASVTYSPVWLCKGRWNGSYNLDGKQVVGISSYLFETGTIDDLPKKLKANSELCFQGSIPNGKGFVITNDEAEELMKSDPKNLDVLYPYLIGKELNIHPEHKPSQWTLNFHDWPLERKSAPVGYKGPCAENYPECLEIIRERVYPERTRRKENGEYKLRKPLPQKWWIYADKRPKLYKKLREIDWALAIAAQATKYVAFAKVHGKCVYSHALSLVVTDNYGVAAILQSSIHEVWARQYAGNNLLLLRYSPTDVLETFALPIITDSLITSGNAYYELREQLLLKNNEGLTSTYNHFHNPEECGVEMQKFREVQVDMDIAVAAAYGWDDLELGHDFRKTKQGIRFTISEKARREVLQRLLKLNHERYEEEVKQGLHNKKKKKTEVVRGKRKSAAKDDGNTDLFDFMKVSLTEPK